MTISHPADIDQVEIDKARLVADSFKADDALLETIVIPACTSETAARFLAKVEVANNGCLWWTACLTRDGYGQFKICGKTYRAHRVALTWRIGGIPTGYTAGHRCHDADPTCPGGVDCLHRRCVNPEHLIAETQRANLLAGNTNAADQAARDKCPRGHILSGVNLDSGNLRQGGRACRICKVIYDRAYSVVRRYGGNQAEARNAGRRAIAALSGDETPTSICLSPLQLHYETDLYPWRQCSFDLGEVG